MFETEYRRRILMSARRLDSVCHECRTGQCCKVLLSVSDAEVRDIIEHNCSFVRKRLDQVRYNAQYENLTPAEYANKGLQCPFNIDGRCAVYNVRPIACAIHYVAPGTDPNMCATVGAPIVAASWPWVQQTYNFLSGAIKQYRGLSTGVLEELNK